METKLLTPNKWSRPYDKLKGIKGLVVHWVENPKTSAEANWGYFENRKAGETGYGSTHYIVGLDGEVIHMIPDDEMAYHVGAKTYTKLAIERFGPYPNNCTIGIETCHLDWDGHYSTKTLESLAELISHLCRIYDLHPIHDVVRHYDVTEKECPKFFVDRPKAWDWYKYAIAGKYHHWEG